MKNYEGNFFIDGDSWYSISNTEISNPLIQLQRSVTSFRRLLQVHGFSYPIEAYIIFINPEFYLYNAPLNSPLVFPNQINRFLKQIRSFDLKLNDTHTKLVEKLISLHIKDTPFTKIKKYDIKQVKKGIICTSCQAFYTNNSLFGYLRCNNCGNKEAIEPAILRSIEEYKLLFPNRLITTSCMMDWCGVVSKRSLQEILVKYFKLMKHGRSSYYV